VTKSTQDLQLEHHFTGVQAQRKSKDSDKIQQIYLIAIYLFCHKYWKCTFIRGRHKTSTHRNVVLKIGCLNNNFF
jgi:hypothetical protein